MIASMSVSDDMMPPSIVRLPEWPLFPDNRVPGGPGATAASNKERSNGTGTFHGPTDLTFPHMRPFRPTRPGANTATVLIIFPGGAYHNVARPTGGEGDTACWWFVHHLGVTCFLVYYRVPHYVGPLPWGVGPVLDAQRAIGLVRSRTRELQLNSSRVGVLGLSAGGYLPPQLFVSCTEAASRAYARIDAADDLSCRPDFSAMIYPYYMLCHATKKPWWTAVGISFGKDNGPSRPTTPPHKATKRPDNGPGIGPEELLERITGYPDLPTYPGASIPSSSQHMFYTGHAQLLHYPGCLDDDWSPQQLDPATNLPQVGYLSPAATPPNKLFGKHPPTFLAAETTDPQAMGAIHTYFKALTKRGGAAEGFRLDPDALHPEHCALHSARVEMHLYNSSGAHGSGVDCMVNRPGQRRGSGWGDKPLDPSFLNRMCELWPLQVAHWMAGLGLVELSYRFPQDSK